MPERKKPENGSVLKKTLHCRIEGMVQGVGFRYSTLHQARRLGLNGYVRNLWDGTVEVVAEGADEKLRQLERWLNHGPPGAVVRRIHSHYSPFQGVYRSFGIDF
ncbi:MAG: acylphosphatase [Spirochaetales bacterium]|nr:acylphosphatase [Spirochaetales bacterium]